MTDEEQAQRIAMARRTVTYTVPGMDDVIVRKDLAYADGVSFDLYAPPATPGEPAAARPAVIFASGFPDPGGRLRQMGAFTSWGRLVAASGMIGVTYANRAPVADLDLLLAHLRADAAALGLDPERLAVWACSGHGPTALDALARHPFRAAALLYPYTIGAAGAAAGFGFADPFAGRTVDDLPADLPMMIVRAGRDEMPGLNAALDRFAAAALARNLPITIANHAAGVHSFDVSDAGVTSHALVAAVLAFLRAHTA